MNYNDQRNDSVDRGPMQAIVEEVSTFLGGGERGDEVSEGSAFDVTPGAGNTPPEVRDESVDEDTGSPTG